MRAQRAEDLLLCHAVFHGLCEKQVLRPLRGHQDDDSNSNTN